MSLAAKKFVVGVDGGASKTAVVVIDEFGQPLGRGRSGSANYHHLGVDGVGVNLLKAMRAAAKQAGLNLEKATAVTWALSGVDRPIDRQLMVQLAENLLPGIPVFIENDAVAALVAGLSETTPQSRPRVSHIGIVLIAGTGMNTFGQNKQGEYARSGGWGYLLEEGSAYNLALNTLRAIMQSSENISHPTHLTESVLGHLGLTHPSDIITWLYAPQRQVSEVAAVTPIVLAEAEADDLLAIQVVKTRADILAQHVVSLAHKLNFQMQPFQLVFAGSLITKSAFFRQLVIQAVKSRLPYVQPVLPQLDAAVGAGLLALEKLGLTDPLLRQDTIHENTAWTTEQNNILTRNIDLVSTTTQVGLMHLQDKQAVESLWPILPNIAAAVDAITPRMRQGGRLIYVGAGTSGRLGILDASECPPTFNTNPDQVIGIIAGGKQAITHAVEDAEDNSEAGAAAMKTLHLDKRDSVVGISASGRAPFVLRALEIAQSLGSLTIALTNNVPAPITGLADHAIVPLVGPETVTGSTRLKAGTTQKLVLNMLSTAVLVRLGKTYGNLMIDLQPTNQKLKERAKRIVAQACDINEMEAANALTASQGDIKLAIISTLTNSTTAEAQERLDKSNGVVREAIQT